MPTEIDKDLLNALKAAKGGTPMQFAFVSKGTEGKLLVGKKVAPKAIADAKKEVGGTAVVRGRLVVEDGVLVFEVAKEPPGTLAAQLKRRLKEDAGLTMPVETRVKADAEAQVDGEGGAVPAAPPPPPNGAVPPPPADAAKAAVLKRLNALGAGIKAALAGPGAARVQTLFVAINGHVKGNDFAQAGTTLDELEALVTGAAPSESGPGAEYEALLARLTPDVKRCLKEQRGDTGKIRALLGFAQGKAEAGNHAAAVQSLQALQALVAVALAAGAAPEGGSDGVVELAKNRLRWKKASDKVADQLTELKETALDEIDEPDAPSVAKKLDVLGKRLEDFGGRLSDALDAVANGDGAARLKASGAAADLAEEYLAFVEKSALLRHAVAHPFDSAAVEAESELAAPLRQLVKQLKAARA